MPKADIQTMVIRELRENEGRIAHLSRLSGISYRYIRAVMLEEIKNPAHRRLVRLASYLGIAVISVPIKHLLKEKA